MKLFLPGWDVGHQYFYDLDQTELQIWIVSDALVEDPPTVEVSVSQEIIEQTWEWEEPSDIAWARLMYYFAVVEDSDM